jgi:hypothetical protein
MFEALLNNASLLKKVVEALKDLVTDANLECHPDALTLQVSVSILPKKKMVHIALLLTHFFLFNKHSFSLTCRQWTHRTFLLLL